MSSSGQNDGVSGEQYIAQLAQYIRAHSEQLSAWSTARQRVPTRSNTGWSSFLPQQDVRPLTLTLTLYHLYFVLLKIQEAGFADVGDMDRPLPFGHARRTALPASVAIKTAPGVSDTASVMTGLSRISKSMSSFSTGWWGTSASSSATNTAKSLEINLKLIYTAFTLLPSLQLVLQDRKGKARAIDGFDFPDLPGDRMLPLQAFKSLERLELSGIDARVLLLSNEWDNIVTIKARDCSVEELQEMLLCRTPDAPSAWRRSLRTLDIEHNDITNIDASETVGLGMLHTLSLRKNLLVSVPQALANLTSLRALDLSDNMIDSVTAIYKALPALSVLNLRGNRISSLCGIERLLSLEKLDLRDNDIDDSAELLRIATLPHISDVWVGFNNPFLDHPASHKDQGWRVAFFSAALLASARLGSVPDRLDAWIRLDAAAPTWQEQRHLPSVTPSNSLPTSPAAPSFQSPSIKANEFASTASPRTRVPTTRSVRSSRSQHLPYVPSPLQSPTTAEGPASPPDLKSRTVKKKHRRVIDLNSRDVSGAQEPENSSKHARSQTTSALAPSYADCHASQNSDTASPLNTFRDQKTKSLPSRSKKTNSSNTARYLSSDTFTPPTHASDVSTRSDNGDVEDFRTRMEKMRREVGSSNWLSVYANESTSTA